MVYVRFPLLLRNVELGNAEKQEVGRWANNQRRRDVS
jgi:hypothetical protein